MALYQGEGHGQRHRLEEERTHAGHEGERSEHQEGAQGRNQLGQGDFAGSEEGGLLRIGPHAQVPVRVLEADDGAVDHRPDGERQSGERHHVDRVAGGVQAHDGGQH
jgi:hypothetical protein